VLAVALLLGIWQRDRIPGYTRQGRELGLWLREAAAPTDTLAVSAAGAIPYYSRLPTLDVLGITDPAVSRRRARHTGEFAPGHHRYDIGSLLQRRPHWIVWDFGVALNEQRMRQLSTTDADPDRLDYRRSLLARKEFRNGYVIDRRAPVSRTYTVFRRR
jgi:hypothetical protein